MTKITVNHNFTMPRTVNLCYIPWQHVIRYGKTVGELASSLLNAPWRKELLVLGGDVETNPGPVYGNLPEQAPMGTTRSSSAHSGFDFSCLGTESTFTVRVSSRRARRWRKLYIMLESTASLPSLHATFVACSTQISYCKRRTLRTRPWTGLRKTLPPDVV